MTEAAIVRGKSAVSSSRVGLALDGEGVDIEDAIVGKRCLSLIKEAVVRSGVMSIM